jgi:hypothetical protein
MLEPIPFAGFVEIDDPTVCCNGDCNQGRDCPLRKKELTDEEIEGIARANVDGHSSMEQLKWFARAILRKAQEK